MVSAFIKANPDLTSKASVSAGFKLPERMSVAATREVIAAGGLNKTSF